jgi:hypothetical protein
MPFELMKKDIIHVSAADTYGSVIIKEIHGLPEPFEPTSFGQHFKGLETL